MRLRSGRRSKGGAGSRTAPASDPGTLIPAADRPSLGTNLSLVNPPSAPESLRPLGLGELLDRAVTLCVTHFVPFALIYVAFAIPLGIVKFFASRNLTMLIEAFADQLKGQSAGHAPNPAAYNAAFAQAGDNFGWTAALFALTFFVGPLATAALIEATSATYLGGTTNFAKAYRAGLSRWLPMLGINIFYAVAGGVLYVIAIVVALLLFFALGAITLAAHALGIAISIVVGLAVAIVLIGIAVVVALALNVSYFSCVVERENTIVAFASGIGRVFSGVGLKRSLLVGSAYVAVIVGIWLVSALGQGVLVGVVRSELAGTIFTTLVAVATAAFLTAFMTIFYYDLRVREEGLDLQMAASRALGAPPLEIS